jgi:hypothetical protein
VKHSWDELTRFCVRCGIHMAEVNVGLWPTACPAAANVHGVTHRIAAFDYKPVSAYTRFEAELPRLALPAPKKQGVDDASAGP